LIVGDELVHGSAAALAALEAEAVQLLHVVSDMGSIQQRFGLNETPMAAVLAGHAERATV
jgi:hypothetical protein